MKAKLIVAGAFLSIAASFVAACRGADPSNEKVIKSVKSGELTITLSSSTGELKNGENDLMITFFDGAGKSVDVGAASLNFHMAAMGSMAEMNDRATLTTTEIPGKYRAHVNIEMAGSWEAQIKYQGPHGSGRESMTVRAK
ncbi:MAG TPA: FixH family protein [Blastocatellia bacterium]|nr:FixH family protein [Blastocatellia bacterium]